MNSMPVPSLHPRPALMAALVAFAAITNLSAAAAQPARKPTGPARPAVAAATGQGASPTTTEATYKTNVKGPADAPIRVVEFADFMCPGCQAASQALKQYYSQQGNDINLTFKNFPLDKACNQSMDRTIHNGACELALGSICAAELGSFWPYHDRIFSRSWEPAVQVTRKDVLDNGVALGMDKAKLEACMNSSAASSKLALQIKEGVEVQVVQTPTLVVNGRKLSSPNQFANAVEEERRKLAAGNGPSAPAPSPKK